MTTTPIKVVDASVVTDAIVSSGEAGRAAREALRGMELLPVPAVFDAEVRSAVRRLRGRGQISAGRADAAREAIRRTRTHPYPMRPFLDRIWELRDNVTVYDGWYVALAERLGLELLTADQRLADAPGPRCRIRLVATGA